jgi:hypothetical protein
MVMVSDESIDYRKLCDRNAVIEPWKNSIITILPRNCVPFNGIRLSVTDLRTSAITPFVQTILIPYSLYTISKNASRTTLSDAVGTIYLDVIRPKQLRYLVFEFGSELQSITDAPFAKSRLTSLFIPPTLRFIGPSAFFDCASVACIHFVAQSSLRQLNEWVFAKLSHINAITIRSSVKRIEGDAFRDCRLLRVVEFGLPSQYWSICRSAFQFCSLLEPISLPS